ncbi:hypothetical protein PCE1_001793 [Barthelona sp. PCE]
MPSISDMSGLIGYSLLSILASFLCSLLESSLLSVPYSYVVNSAETGSKAGKKMLKLKDSLDRPLAAILSMNTIAHTIGASGVGAATGVVFGEKWVTLSSAILTLAMLSLSEILPKTIGANSCKKLMGFTGTTINILIIIVYPLVWLCEKLSSCLGGEGEGHGVVSRDEIKTIADLALDAEQISKDEAQFIKNIIRVTEVPIADIMTPRIVLKYLEADSTVGEIIEQGLMRYARMPVFGETMDHRVGWVHRNTLHELNRVGRGDTLIGEIALPVTTVAETESVPKCFTEMLKRREQMFIVVDEFGGTDGLISMEDVLESILGLEIMDEFDDNEDLREVARKMAQSRSQNAEIRSSQKNLRKNVNTTAVEDIQVTLDVNDEFGGAALSSTSSMTDTPLMQNNTK